MTRSPTPDNRVRTHPPGGRPYADGVGAYALAGWPCVLPVPVATKFPPPAGFTGDAGRDTDPAQLVTWAGPHAEQSIAVRMPDGVIGLDVDHYDKTKTLPDGTTAIVRKRGADTLAEYEQRWGPLPPTWRSSARPAPSGIRFYRVPTGRYATKLGDAIEVIQRHHRYAVVWPSGNPDAGGAGYGWYRPDGALSATVPRPDEFPQLPEAWVAGLREGASQAGPAAADAGSGQALLGRLLSDGRQPCAEMADAIHKAHLELDAAASGSRHDTATARAHHLVQLGAAGHPGAGEALADLRELWADLTAGEDREGEFERMLLTSARKAVSVVGVVPVDRDPCFGGQVWAAPAPAGDNVAPAVAAARRWSVREVVGAHPWDPQSNLDHEISKAALQRMWPVLRYATDAGTWLLRGPERWETRGDLTNWAVHDLAELMPRGDNPVPKEVALRTEAHWQAARRARLMMTPGRNSVAATMTAAVEAGTHPSALRLADLDTDPGILWAGGIPWDLRASTNRPVPAWLDPGTPHLHSAAVAPAEVPTPRWDAFLAAVWPDPQIRAWALRVLAIAFTGVPDAALPILLGPERRGKSQVIHLLMSILGSYAVAANPKLLGNGDNSHDSIVYALLGRRLAFIDEGPREGRWAQERLKQLTGGAALTGNAMRTNPVTFNPTHTLILTCNDEPPLTDPAVRARVRLIPCDGDEAAVRAARQAIGATDGSYWQTEAPGVLWKMIVEAARWYDDPDTALTAAAPPHIRGQAVAIAAEQDVVKQWIDEACERYEPGTPAGTLHEAFVGWCRNNGIKDTARPTSSTKWGRQVTKLGYPRDRQHGQWYRPLRVRAAGGYPPPAGPVASPQTGSGPVWPTNRSEAELPAQSPLFDRSQTGWTGWVRPLPQNFSTEISGSIGVTGPTGPDTPQNLVPEQGEVPPDRLTERTGPAATPAPRPGPAGSDGPATGGYTVAAQQAAAQRREASRSTTAPLDASPLDASPATSAATATAAPGPCPAGVHPNPAPDPARSTASEMTPARPSLTPDQPPHRTQPDTTSEVAPMAIANPTALDDQIRAAGAELGAQLRQAADREQLPYATTTAPDWLAESVRRHVDVLSTDQARFCPHLTGTPSIACAFSWAPGVLVCPACIALAAPSETEDTLCDRCRQPSEAIRPGVAQLGAILFGFGLCPSCHTEATRA